MPAGTPIVDAWPLGWEDADSPLVGFVRTVLQVRRVVPVLRQRRFFDGRARTVGYPDLVWFAADGHELVDEDWHDERHRTLQAWIDGSELGTVTATGKELSDSSGLFVLHAGDAAELTLAGPEWYCGDILCVFDSSTADGRPIDAAPHRVGSAFPVTGPTVLVFRIAADTPSTAQRKGAITVTDPGSTSV